MPIIPKYRCPECKERFETKIEFQKHLLDNIKCKMTCDFILGYIQTQIDEEFPENANSPGE